RGGDAADRVIRSPTPLLNTKLKELPKNTTKRDLTAVATHGGRVMLEWQNQCQYAATEPESWATNYP
ncbi:hypothetical protein, partial [Brevibacterium aurantiacum]|uniref:hypothetical protein n=1 Tax=Brevibacterium aurantiacum TaxID=273384 RepID=UPI001D003540